MHFANLLVMECYVQDALQKELLITSFLDPQNNYFEKVYERDCSLLFS